MNIQWFPGHMTKTRRQIEEKLKLIDVVVEVLDARIPLSSKNPDISEITKSKPRIVVLNKSDLADNEVTKKWIEYYKSIGICAIAADCAKGKGVNESISLVKSVIQDKIAKDSDKGMNRAIKILVAGVPNAGKSSYINRLAGRASATVGDRPGVTRGQQWIRLKSGVELLDTPGILWPKFENEIVAHNLALCGAIKDDILPLDDVISYGLSFMQKYYPDNLNNRYGVNITDDMELLDIYEVIGRKRNCLLKGNQIDYDRVVNLVLFDLRHNKLGAMSYDRCSEYV